MKLKRPESVFSSAGFCPGCGHGLASRLVGEVAEELGIAEQLITVVDVACCSFNIDYWNFDTIMAAHGRDIPTAVGVKHIRPNNPVLAYMGDGAAYSIGMAETIHAALRNDNICVVVINNSVFGMTGGQMAPTSLPGQKTATSPMGKDPSRYGTLSAVELLKGMDIAYLARGELVGVAGMNKAKAMLKKAMQHQLNGDGFSLVELLSPCHTNLNLPPVEAKTYVHEEMTKFYPVGEFIDKEGKN